MKKLYDYQQEAVDKTDLYKKGIIVLPTGGGKTIIQSEIIATDIRRHLNQFRMYVVNAPRIILTYQLLKEICVYLMKKNISAKFHFVHSGDKMDENDINKIREELKIELGYDLDYSQTKPSLERDKLVDVINNSKDTNKPLIVFSTYHSAEKIEEARTICNVSISIILNDEGHYMVQEGFHDLITTLKSDRLYFFTATTRDDEHLDDGRGMNNLETWGEIIFQRTPKQIIDLGKMVRPLMLELETDGIKTEDDFKKSFNLVILNTFKQHKEDFDINYPRLKPKILVSTNGAEQIKPFLESNEYQELRDMGVDIFAIHSSKQAKIGNDFNGVKVKRSEFLSTLQKYGENEDKMIIVLHYDILTEGIDVPGLTSIFVFRNLLKSKFVQSFGRCARIDTRDRNKFKDVKFPIPFVESEWVKPWAFVIFPKLTESTKQYTASMKAILYELRDKYYNPSQFINEETKARGVSSDDDEEPLDSGGILGRLIRRYKLEQEDKRIASLSEEEQFIENLEEYNENNIF